MVNAPDSLASDQKFKSRWNLNCFPSFFLHFVCVCACVRECVCVRACVWGGMGGWGVGGEGCGMGRVFFFNLAAAAPTSSTICNLFHFSAPTPT